MHRRSSLVLVILLSLTPRAWAQESAAPAPPVIGADCYELSLTPKYIQEASDSDLWEDYADRWHYRSNLSIWAAGIHGNVGKGDFDADIDASFSDIFDKANGGAGLDFELGKGPISLVVFGQYLHLEADGSTPQGFDTDSTTQYGLVDVALAYNLLNIPVGSASRLYFDAMGGTRWTFLSAEIEVNEGPLAGRSEKRDKNWFDPYVGARARFDFDRNINFSVLANYGAFGGGSDSTWCAYAQFEYRFNEKWSIVAGYRALNYNYGGSRGFNFDATLQGPVIGLGVRF